MTKLNIGDSIASEMNNILGNSEFQSIFKKPELTNEYNEVLSQDNSYKAFVRVAKKQDGDKAEAVKYIIENLTQASEALDNIGLEKSATVALALINGIIKEAQDFSMDETGGRLKELDSRTPEELIFEEEMEGDNESEEGEEGSIFDNIDVGDMEKADAEEGKEGIEPEFMADDCLPKLASTDKDKERAKKEKEKKEKEKKAKEEKALKEKEDKKKKLEKEKEEKAKKKEKEKKAYIITDRKVLAMVDEIDRWLEEE